MLTNDCNHIISVANRLLSEKANDEVFQVQLKNLKYLPNGGNKTIRYFFSTLCDYYRWHREGEQAAPYADKEYVINYDNVTIEHIHSQHPEETGVFPAEETHKLCNLTILSQDDNGRRVSNKPFSEKKAIYASSRYEINKILCEYDKWTLSNAEAWQQAIVDLACKIFKI